MHTYTILTSSGSRSSDVINVFLWLGEVLCQILYNNEKFYCDSTTGIG